MKAFGRLFLVQLPLNGSLFTDSGVIGVALNKQKFHHSRAMTGLGYVFHCKNLALPRAYLQHDLPIKRQLS